MLNVLITLSWLSMRTNPTPNATTETLPCGWWVTYVTTISEFLDCIIYNDWESVFLMQNLFVFFMFYLKNYHVILVCRHYPHFCPDLPLWKFWYFPLKSPLIHYELDKGVNNVTAYGNPEREFLELYWKFESTLG